MSRVYEFSYKNFEFSIYNEDIYEELYTLRDLNIFYSLLDLDDKFINEIVGYEKRIRTIINEIELDYSLGSGLCGFGYMYHFMSITNSSYKKEKDRIDILLKKLVIKFINRKIPIVDSTGNFSVVYDYFKGMSGIFAYVIQTIDDLNIQGLIVHHLIYEISHIDCNKIFSNLGIAHGLSSLLNILRLDNNYCYTKNEIKVIEKLISNIENNLRTKIMRSNRISLSWGNGDFGIVFSIFSISKKLGIDISNNFYELVKFIINKGDRFIYEKLNPCNGIYGFNRMLKIMTSDNKESWLNKYQEEIATENFIICNNLKGRNVSIIDGYLSKILVENICEINLDEYYKLFML